MLLQCQSAYSGTLRAGVNLAAMDRLAEIGRAWSATSGHERGYHADCAAVTAARRSIYTTTDKTPEGNDHTVSLPPEEFKADLREVDGWFSPS